MYIVSALLKHNINLSEAFTAA